jgi:hypothetical protein
MACHPFPPSRRYHYHCIIVISVDGNFNSSFSPFPGHHLPLVFSAGQGGRRTETISAAVMQGESEHETVGGRVRTAEME